MRIPEAFTARELVNWTNQVEIKPPAILEGIYIAKPWYRPARPEAHTVHPFWQRFKAAWNVLIGKYDAVNWGD